LGTAGHVTAFPDLAANAMLCKQNNYVSAKKVRFLQLQLATNNFANNVTK
jgi:hypothetical protein